MKGKAAGWKWLVGGALAVLAFLWITGNLEIPSIPSFRPAPAAVVQPEPTEVPEGIRCPTDLTVDLNVRAKNPLNASLEWVGATIYYAQDGISLGSATLNTDGTYKTITSGAECGEYYDLYTLNDADYVAVSKKGILAQGASVEVDLEIPKSTDVEFKLLDNTYTDVNGTSGFYKDVTVPSTAISFSSGDVKTYYLKVRTVSGAAQFGSDELPVYICADFNLAKFSKSNGVIISGATPVELPTYCAINGYDKAWMIEPIKSTEGERTYTITIRADLGDPGTSDDIKFLFIDSHYYLGNDGTIKWGTADDTGTAVGESDRWIVVNLA